MRLAMPKNVKVLLGKGASDEERALKILAKQERNERKRSLYNHDQRIPSKSCVGRFGLKLNKSSSSKCKLIIKESKSSDDLVFGLSSTGRIGQDDLSPEVPSDSLVGRLSAQWHVKHRRVSKEESPSEGLPNESNDEATGPDARTTLRASAADTAPVSTSLRSVPRGSFCQRCQASKHALRHKRALSARCGLLTDETREQLLSKEPSKRGSIKVPLAVDSDRLLSSKQPLPPISLRGRLRRRKETARLRLEQSSANLSQITVLKRPVDENGNPIPSKSLAGCLTTTCKRDTKGSRHGKSHLFRRRKSCDTLSIDSSTTELNNSLVGRLKKFTACTKAQLERQGRRDILNATASTCSESFCLEKLLEDRGYDSDSARKHRVKNPQALELAIEMREAMEKRGMQERRVGIHVHPETFLHSEAVMWLTDRQVQFEEEKCRREQETTIEYATTCPNESNDAEGITSDTALLSKYSRYEDNLLDWKACHTGDMIKKAGYIVQLNGKDGFRAHRKLNCVFKFNEARISRDVLRLQRLTDEGANGVDDSVGILSKSAPDVLLFEHSKVVEHSDSDLIEDESLDCRPLRTSGFFDRSAVTAIKREEKSSATDVLAKPPKKASSTARIMMVDEQERAILKVNKPSSQFLSVGNIGNRARSVSCNRSTSIPPTTLPNNRIITSRSLHANAALAVDKANSNPDVITKLRQKEELNEQKRIELQKQHSVARLMCLGGM